MRNFTQKIVLWRPVPQNIVYLRSFEGKVLQTTSRAKEAMVFDTIVSAKQFLKKNNLHDWNWCHLDE